MMVTRQMADNALADLSIGVPLDHVTEELVQQSYRDAAKSAHPDCGGSMEAFVKVDRAKGVLVAWLKRPRPAPSDSSIATDTCLQCHGTGKRTLRRGFNTMTMMCGSCRGTGERPEREEPGE